MEVAGYAEIFGGAVLLALKTDDGTESRDTGGLQQQKKARR